MRTIEQEREIATSIFISAVRAASRFLDASDLYEIVDNVLVEDRRFTADIAALVDEPLVRLRDRIGASFSWESEASGFVCRVVSAGWFVRVGRYKDDDVRRPIYVRFAALPRYGEPRIEAYFADGFTDATMESSVQGMREAMRRSLHRRGGKSASAEKCRTILRSMLETVQWER